ncbi:phthiocerol/phthiodiolone dimycocerosyl transferase family protein [Nocardia inohanensis]|uniref:phthiocerol/phthiodiolone dimycocerosyl transferase family protein n=1 Tax=Nocardia inohanensis TaxID=209246 RepID=UPI00082FD5D1|nr:hypothetical protein [Nocardia inohanensis]
MDTEIQRPLSPSERWYHVCDRLSPLNVVARVRLHGDLPEHTLRTAAQALTAEHPLLRVSIVSAADGTAPAFVPAADPHLPIAIVDDTTWERRVDEVELNTALDSEIRPLARITDVRTRTGDGGETHDLLLTVSHVIADATTALTLLRRLIELAAAVPGQLGHASPGSDSNVAGGDLPAAATWNRPDPGTRDAGAAPEARGARSALPAPDAMLPTMFRGAPGVLTALGSGLVDQIAGAALRPRRLPAQRAVTATERHSRLVHRELAADTLAALLARCAAEEVTVHGALTAAMAQAYGNVAAAGESGRVTIGAPMNFRDDLRPPVSSDEVGAYVATVPSTPRFGPAADFWPVARSVNRQLRRRKRFRQHLAQIALLPAICPASPATSARAVKLVDTRGNGNICLSNIGRYDFPDRVGEWRFSGAQFVAGISISGNFVASVNTSHDALHWNFTYIETAVAAERAERLADESLAVLYSALGLPHRSNSEKPCPTPAMPS